MSHENDFEGSDGGTMPVINHDCGRCESWAFEYTKLESELSALRAAVGEIGELANGPAVMFRLPYTWQAELRAILTRHEAG
jgi:hypothetical protein